MPKKSGQSCLKHSHVEIGTPIWSSPLVSRPYVLQCYVVSWEDVRRRVNDGRLPSGHVVWLLDIEVKEEMVGVLC